MFTSSALASVPAASQLVGSDRKSMPRPMFRVVVGAATPSTLAKRMSCTSGAMPAKRGLTVPLPAMVPVTWVPWPTASIQRS